MSTYGFLDLVCGGERQASLVLRIVRRALKVGLVVSWVFLFCRHILAPLWLALIGLIPGKAVRAKE
jgi:hypothetical protein